MVLTVRMGGQSMLRVRVDSLFCTLSSPATCDTSEDQSTDSVQELENHAQ